VPLLGPSTPDADDGWTLDGRIDYITTEKMGDLKSTATADSWSQQRARIERQPGIYDLCRMQDWPLVLPNFEFPVVAKDTYAVTPYQVRLTQQRRDAALVVAQVVAKAIDQSYFPRNPEGCRWCPLRKQGGC